MFLAEPVRDISRRLRGAIKAEMVGSNPWVWPSNLAIVIKVFALALRGLQLRLEWLHKQRFASLADDEYLDLHATEEGLSRVPALYASGYVDIVTVAGTVIPAATEMLHGSQSYLTTAETTATTTLTRVLIQAVEPGTAGNLDPGATLTLVTPITGVGDVTVADDFYGGTGGVIGGAEAESNDSLRERILFHKRNPPSGGAPSEYIEWSRRKSGVTRVWVKRATPAPGQVTIYFAMDNAYPNGIPNSDEAADLLALLEELAPADAAVIVSAPTTTTINVVIAALTPDTPTVREGVVQEIAAMFLRRAEPGEVFARDWISEAVQSVAGLRRARVTTPSGDTTPSAGQLPILGTVTFT